jgi:hypothetical protein
VGGAICLGEVRFTEIDWRSCRFFFENREKPARFLDLLLEPFLPMPIYLKVYSRSRYRPDCRLTNAVYGNCVI